MTKLHLFCHTILCSTYIKDLKDMLRYFGACILENLILLDIRLSLQLANEQ